MAWDLKPDRPIYTQLIEKIQLKIFSGEYPLGSNLPSVRDLASEASVNPNTMQRALAKLEEDGLVVTHRTKGRTITEDADMVKQAKNKLAQIHIFEFLEKMQLMGFSKDEVLVLISEMLKEMKK
ncbi:MAG: GntR family transcriptional regulator [Clostridiaceae bacterium]|nr:GntR family transcriptional regulator [Clostridiaceae bacterium]